jgi:hypothetical protein
MSFTLPDLPYSYTALEPFIDSQTMHLHHTGHHQAYVNKLNEALGKVSNYTANQQNGITRPLTLYSFRLFIVYSFRLFIFYYSVLLSFHPFILSSFNPFILSSFHPFILSSFRPFILSSFHPFILSSFHPLITLLGCTTQHSGSAKRGCKAPRCCEKQWRRPLQP